MRKPLKSAIYRRLVEQRWLFGDSSTPTTISSKLSVEVGKNGNNGNGGNKSGDGRDPPDFVSIHNINISEVESVEIDDDFDSIKDVNISDVELTEIGDDFPSIRNLLIQSCRTLLHLVAFAILSLFVLVGAKGIGVLNLTKGEIGLYTSVCLGVITLANYFLKVLFSQNKDNNGKKKDKKKKGKG